jgi:serine/threonine-protein kinase SRPK3
MFIKSTELGEQLNNVLDIYNRIKGASKKHHGRESIRSLDDSFDIGRPEDKHICLVHPALVESISAFTPRNPIQRLPAQVLAGVLQRVFWALDYLSMYLQTQA